MWLTTFGYLIFLFNTFIKVYIHSHCLSSWFYFTIFRLFHLSISTTKHTQLLLNLSWICPLLSRDFTFLHYAWPLDSLLRPYTFKDSLLSPGLSLASMPGNCTRGGFLRFILFLMIRSVTFRPFFSTSSALVRESWWNDKTLRTGAWFIIYKISCHVFFCENYSEGRLSDNFEIWRNWRQKCESIKLISWGGLLAF